MSQYQPHQYDPRLHAQRLAQRPPWETQSAYYGQSGQTTPAYQQQPQHQSPQPARRPARSAPPYPAHLVRFPSGMLPRSRRKSGPSAARIFYLGRHPIALLIEGCLTLFAVWLVAAWTALVITAWAVWTLAVTIVWICQAVAARTRR